MLLDGRCSSTSDDVPVLASPDDSPWPRGSIAPGRSVGVRVPAALAGVGVSEPPHRGTHGAECARTSVILIASTLRGSMARAGVLIDRACGCRTTDREGRPSRFERKLNMHPLRGVSARSGGGLSRRESDRAGSGGARADGRAVRGRSIFTVPSARSWWMAMVACRSALLFWRAMNDGRRRSGAGWLQP